MLAQAHQAFGADGRIASATLASATLASATLQQRFEATLECFLDLVEVAKHYRPLKKLWVEYLSEHPNAATGLLDLARQQPQAVPSLRRSVTQPAEASAPPA
jgi:hypothetical protein